MRLLLLSSRWMPWLSLRIAGKWRLLWFLFGSLLVLGRVLGPKRCLWQFCSCTKPYTWVKLGQSTGLVLEDFSWFKLYKIKWNNYQCPCCWVPLVSRGHKNKLRSHFGYLACPDRILPIVYAVFSHRSNWCSDSLTQQLISRSYFKDKVLMEISIYILTEVKFKLIVILPLNTASRLCSQPLII